MRLGYITDKGKLRQINEDAFYACKEEPLYLVADGVGGSNAGEVASKLAVTHVAQKTKEQLDKNKQGEKYIFGFFQKCLKEVNEEILQVAKAEAQYLGMATTLVGVYLSKGNAYFFNVGDSRAYLIRNGKMMQITEDHTLVNKYVKEGKMTKEEALIHPNSNMITRALGIQDYSNADTFCIPIKIDDIVLLCSDGLSREVSDQSILEILQRENDMEKALEKLVEEANNAGGRDNITIVGLKVGLYEQ